jgi:hypothetical protein
MACVPSVRRYSPTAPPLVAPAGELVRHQHVHNHAGLRVAGAKSVEAIVLQPALLGVTLPAFDRKHRIDVAVQQQGRAWAIGDTRDRIRLLVGCRL